MGARHFLDVLELESKLFPFTMVGATGDAMAAPKSIGNNEARPPPLRPAQPFFQAKTDDSRWNERCHIARQEYREAMFDDIETRWGQPSNREAKHASRVAQGVECTALRAVYRR